MSEVVWLKEVVRVLFLVFVATWLLAGIVGITFDEALPYTVMGALANEMGRMKASEENG